VKKMIFVVATLVVAAVAYFVGHTGAQTAAPPAPATKVGVVNIGLIFSKYEKVKLFRAEFEKELKPFKDEEEKLKKLIIDWQNALSNPESKLTDAQKDQGTRTIKDCKRRLEDLALEYRKKVSKRTEEQLVQLYKEVNDKIKNYAVAQGFHMILGYGEPMDGDLLSFVNVTRKMQAMDQGGVIPMYFAGWMDISPHVLVTLNQGYPTTPPIPMGGSATGTGVPK
jgi:Skp family chaperone for outer membrane proteins